jgi:Na+/melibiose symporter-like transporter
MSWHRLLPLLTLFGALYFIQGIVEPTAALPAQPLQTQLRGWGLTTEGVGQFFGIIGIAWSLKPLFGVISDFLPILGSRRRSYLVLSTAATGILYAALAWLWSLGHLDTGRWLLVAICVGIAFTDVVVDALAVEVGQPLGITGQIQSVQWGAISLAAVLTGSAGGFVAARGLLRPTFWLCSAMALVSLAVVLLVVREPKHEAPRENLRLAWGQIRQNRRWAMLVAAAAFLFLWNFNPFSSNVLQQYMTEELNLGEQFYGHSLSVMAAAQTAACIAYYFYCRRVPFGWLVHGSIAAGIVSSLCYWLLWDAKTAMLASVAFGLAYQTATLVQLDLAARICPTAAAGLTFALLMSLSNTGMSAGIYLGGGWYDDLTAVYEGNRHLAFDVLVGIGGAFTGACWLLIPVMKWSGIEWK